MSSYDASVHRKVVQYCVTHRSYYFVRTAIEHCLSDYLKVPKDFYNASK